jgi:hypothetical protein
MDDRYNSPKQKIRALIDVYSRDLTDELLDEAIDKIKETFTDRDSARTIQSLLVMGTRNYKLDIIHYIAYVSSDAGIAKLIDILKSTRANHKSRMLASVAEKNSYRDRDVEHLVASYATERAKPVLKERILVMTSIFNALSRLKQSIDCNVDRIDQHLKEYYRDLIFVNPRDRTKPICTIKIRNSIEMHFLRPDGEQQPTLSAEFLAKVQAMGIIHIEPVEEPPHTCIFVPLDKKALVAKIIKLYYR